MITETKHLLRQSARLTKIINKLNAFRKVWHPDGKLEIKYNDCEPDIEKLTKQELIEFVVKHWNLGTVEFKEIRKKQIAVIKLN